ncbi:hypothetical protein PUN28_009424 [Cardiocondyla obscurior]|uniref:Uncharacterized protein n=1 Tax=Cardiocondyla obscurior TaxID=286306 RepID=A0AAW2FXI1_9HYME
MQDPIVERNESCQVEDRFSRPVKDRPPAMTYVLSGTMNRPFAVALRKGINEGGNIFFFCLNRDYYRKIARARRRKSILKTSNGKNV